MVAPHPNQDSASIPQISFDPTPFLNQLVWRVDYATGNNNNDGLTPGTALATVSEIRRRWNGGLRGVRPQLPDIDITVTIANATGGFSDPESVLWDLDGSAGTFLLIDHTTTVARNGTISAVPNAFARTPTGQQTVTDAGVADWTGDVDKPMLDTSKGSLAWVTAALAAPARGQVQPAYDSPPATQAGIGAVLDAGLTQNLVAATDNYEMLALQQVYFGSQSTTRVTGAGSGDNFIVCVRRAHGVSRGPNDVLSPVCMSSFSANATGAFVVFLECLTDQTRVIDEGSGTIFINCGDSGQDNGSGSHTVEGQPAYGNGMLAGYARREVLFGGETIFDNDFTLLGPFNFATIIGPSFASLGCCARYLNAGDPASSAIFVQSKCALQIDSLFGSPNLMYGTTGGSPIFQCLFASGLYVLGTAVNSLVFDGGSAATYRLGGQASGYGFNRTTGAYVGPTTFTLAHTDAALAAGTGFGNAATDPETQNLFTASGTA